ncbi:hypothetical protein AB0P17_14300 [Streptomyces sp. NPDC088124]|uniref:hypothetical protein n=1 Tax=Streptomyces sp. NPDC088124 TaxID=3154654 RepID=UPI003441234D
MNSTHPNGAPPPPEFIRYQGTARSPRGHFPGVFALANGLARSGALTEEQWRFWRAGNDWYDANYPDPSTVDPLVYDPERHPGAVAWFKPSPEAEPLIARLAGYLELLTAHGVGWQEMRSTDPGRVVYEDVYQVVTVPHSQDQAAESPFRNTGAAPGRSGLERWPSH